MEGITAEQFGNRISEVTLKVLNELIERKREEARCKSAVTRVGFFLIVVFAALIFYIGTQRVFGGFSFEAFRAAFSDPFLWLFAAVFFAGFVRLQQVSKKYEEADEDFETLRCELVERSEELWSEPEQWQNRYGVFTFLEKEYDINLFHK